MLTRLIAEGHDSQSLRSRAVITSRATDTLHVAVVYVYIYIYAQIYQIYEPMYVCMYIYICILRVPQLESWFCLDGLLCLLLAKQSIQVPLGGPPCEPKLQTRP